MNSFLSSISKSPVIYSHVAATSGLKIKQFIGMAAIGLLKIGAVFAREHFNNPMHSGHAIKEHNPLVSKRQVGNLTIWHGCDYVGEIKHGEAHGSGTLSCPPCLEFTYKGKFWRNQLRHGNQTFVKTEKTGTAKTYIGYFENNEWHGKGLAIFGDHSFKGNFKKGRPDGWIEEIDEGVLRFNGTYKNGDREKGRLVRSNGDEYEGEFKEGKYHGQGRLVSSSCGTVYEGELNMGDYHGQGSLKLPNGDILTGEFKKDKLNGRGRWARSDGVTYEGEFKEHKFHGPGELICSNGATLKGEFEAGIFKKLILSDGSILEGKSRYDSSQCQPSLTNWLNKLKMPNGETRDVCCLDSTSCFEIPSIIWNFLNSWTW